MHITEESKQLMTANIPYTAFQIKQNHRQRERKWKIAEMVRKYYFCWEHSQVRKIMMSRCCLRCDTPSIRSVYPNPSWWNRSWMPGPCLHTNLRRHRTTWTNCGKSIRRCHHLRVEMASCSLHRWWWWWWIMKSMGPVKDRRLKVICGTSATRCIMISLYTHIPSLSRTSTDIAPWKVNGRNIIRSECNKCIYIYCFFVKWAQI